MEDFLCWKNHLLSIGHDIDRLVFSSKMFGETIFIFIYSEQLLYHTAVFLEVCYAYSVFLQLYTEASLN